MKNLFLISFCFLFFGLTSYAQEDEILKNKQIYVELGGPGILFSANFDGRFSSKTPLGFGYRLGLGFSIADTEEYYYSSEYGSYYYTSNTSSYLTIPVGVNYILGKDKSPHTFEIGAGATILTRKVSVFNYNGYHPGNFIGHMEFMYRRQPLDGGFTWRIGFTPIIGTSGDIFPSGAVGIGYAF